MNKLNIVFVLSLTSLASILLGSTAYAQKIYREEYESNADIKVYVEQYESNADLNVYMEEYESNATKDGLWYSEKYESNADFRVYFETYESNADLKIYFVNTESNAGWKNYAKQYLLKFKKH